MFKPILIKIKINLKNAEALWKKALEILNKENPYVCCEWCVNYSPVSKALSEQKEKFI